MDTAGVTSALNALESFKVWEYRRFSSVQVQFIPKYSVSKYNLCIICMYFVVYKKVNSSLVTTVQILPTLGSDRGLCNTSEIIIIILVMVMKKCFFITALATPVCRGCGSPTLYTEDPEVERVRGIFFNHHNFSYAILEAFSALFFILLSYSLNEITNTCLLLAVIMR